MTTTKNPKINEDQSFVYNFSLSKAKIQAEKQKVLLTIQKNFKSKGFRPGKAPLDIVETNTSPSDLIEELISRLISPLYATQIKKDKLQPIIPPQLKFLNPPISLDKDWQIEITACQLPILKLKSDYQSQIKKIKAKDDTDKMNQIVQILIKNSQVKFPQVLIDIDLQKQLSSLVNQTKQAGLTVDQYFKSQKTTLVDYRQKLAAQIKDQWILNLSLNKISGTEKITVNQTDQKKAGPQTSPHLIIQQKTLDFLKAL